MKVYNTSRYIWSFINKLSTFHSCVFSSFKVDFPPYSRFLSRSHESYKKKNRENRGLTFKSTTNAQAAHESTEYLLPARTQGVVSRHPPGISGRLASSAHSSAQNCRVAVEMRLRGRFHYVAAICLPRSGKWQSGSGAGGRYGAKVVIEERPHKRQVAQPCHPVDLHRDQLASSFIPPTRIIFHCGLRVRWFLSTLCLFFFFF